MAIIEAKRRAEADRAMLVQSAFPNAAPQQQARNMMTLQELERENTPQRLQNLENSELLEILRTIESNERPGTLVGDHLRAAQQHSPAIAKIKLTGFKGGFSIQWRTDHGQRIARISRRPDDDGSFEYDLLHGSRAPARRELSGPMELHVTLEYPEDLNEAVDQAQRHPTRGEFIAASLTATACSCAEGSPPCAYCQAGLGKVNSTKRPSPVLRTFSLL